jgi:hypothetical protein
MGYKSNLHKLSGSNVRGQHHRTAAQKAEDMERHLQSLKKVAEEESRLGIGEEVDIHKLKVQWLHQIKHRAKSRQLEFDLTIDDLELPSVCPMLGIPLKFNKNGANDDSYSLDRIDNTKGYTKDNVQIISLLANLLKSKGTLDQLIKMGEWAAKQKALVL